MVSSTSPLQQGFYGNIEACLPIGVHFNSALFAPEQGIICTTVSLPNSTAVGTELACMPRIDDVQRNILVKAPLLKVLLEGKERNTHNLAIEPLSFRTESFKVLNRNVGVISQCHFSNLLDNFTYSVFDKIMFVSFEPSKCLLRMFSSSISIALQNRLSLKDFLPLNPNILSEVILMQNFSTRRDDRNSKAFAVYIHSKDILSRRQFNFFFGEVSNNLQVMSKPVGFACPSILEKVGIPLEVAVLLDRHSDTISGVNSEFDKWHGHVESLAVARNVEFDSNSFGHAFASPNSTFQRSINLNVESSPLFGFSKSLSMEVHKSIAEISFIPESVEFRSSLHEEIFENSGLLCSNIINLQKNSSFHTTNHIYIVRKIYNNYARQFIPPIRMGFLVKIR